MPRPTPQPHPRALFSLVPLNERAKAVVAHPHNAELVSYLKGSNTPALDIGHKMSENSTTLATLGRIGDITVEGSAISRIQCAFELNLDTRVVIFYDRSYGRTSQVFSSNAFPAFPFEHDRPRQVVVQEKVNTIIGMGGVGQNLVLFSLVWHCRPDEVTERVKNRGSTLCEEKARLARTDEADTVLPSLRETRIHTPGGGPGSQLPKIRYLRKDLLGRGQFGTVYEAMDMHSGKPMAVKIMHRPTGTGPQQGWVNLKREVEILSRISHVSDEPSQYLVALFYSTHINNRTILWNSSRHKAGMAQKWRS